MTTEATRRLKDPAQLTPYEEKLWGLRKQGMSYGQMSEALNGSSKPTTIAARFIIIKEKLELMEVENEQ